MNAPPPPPGSRLSLLEKIGYGAGDTASNLTYQAANTFLFYYYTVVMGIDGAVIGTIFLATRFWDAINDPLMGILADRTQTRAGRYRPFLLWLAVPYGIIAYLVFAVPDTGNAVQIGYVAVTYVLMGMIYTAINVPYSALMGVMTPDAEQRTILSSFRFVGAFSAALLINSLLFPLVRELGNGNDAEGFRLAFALFATLSAGLFLFTYFSTRERLEPPKSEKANLGKDVGYVLRNAAWRIMIFAGFLTLANVAVRGAVTAHFFEFYVGDDREEFLWFLDRTSLVLSSGSLFFILGIFFTNFLRKRFGKRNSLLGLTFLNAVTLLGFFFIPADKYWTMVTVNALASFLAGPTPALVWAMYTDVADYGEWKFNRRTTGLVFSAAMFAQKLGLMVGGAASGYLLSFYGFDPEGIQSDETIMGIRVMFSIIPGVLAVGNALILIFYPLTEKDTEKISAELAARREQGDEADRAG